jgi:hypothetical protein
MLTGVETTGLVLAALPLFISAFEHYNDGLEPIKAFWDIDRLLPIQIRRLVSALALIEGYLVLSLYTRASHYLRCILR